MVSCSMMRCFRVMPLHRVLVRDDHVLYRGIPHVIEKSVDRMRATVSAGRHRKTISISSLIGVLVLVSHPNLEKVGHVVPEVGDQPFPRTKK